MADILSDGADDCGCDIARNPAELEYKQLRN